MINQTPNDSIIGRQPYFAKHKKANKKGKKNRPQAKQGVNKPQVQNAVSKMKPEKADLKPSVQEVKTEPFEPVYEADVEYNEPQKPNNNKYRNALMGSLMAMAAITMPTVILLDEEPQEYYYHSEPQKEQFEDITCNVDALAKGGKDDYTVEPEEIMQALNFDGIECLPQTEQKAIKSIASVYAQPVNAHDPDARNKVIKQIQYMQRLIDNAINNSPNQPDPVTGERKKSYEEKYITGSELVDNLDYSEILKYQKDVSVLRALLRGGMSRIERNDPNVGEKFDAECEKAQKTIDHITHRYKMNSHIVGNDNYDNAVTAKEIEGVLDKSSLKELSPEEQKSILSGALGSFKTITFTELNNNNDIKKTNQRVGSELQRIQDMVDSEARKALLKKYNINE